MKNQRYLNRMIVTCCCISLLTIVSCTTTSEVAIQSPDQSKSVQIGFDAQKGHAYYSLDINKTKIIIPSALGYQTGSDTIPGKNWSITNVLKFSHDSIWNPLWGKRSQVSDKYNAVNITFTNNKKQGLQQLLLEVRLYNDGLAFRYTVPQADSIPVNRELTQFNFSSDPTAWFYNGEYPNYGPVHLSEVKANRPSDVTLRVSDSLYLNLHEAYLPKGSPLVFSATSNRPSLGIASAPGIRGKLVNNYSSAWRVVMVGRQPGALIDSHLLELLNPDPEPGMDFSWVKPGVAVWDWRINGAVWNGFHYKMDYPSWVRMIDFAARQGFTALVLDANWYGPEHESASNPLNGDKANDVQRIIRYGKQKGVGVWLYLNDVGGRKYPIEQTLQQYGKWGAAGVKYGFMKGSPEEKNAWTQRITRLCAENKLLVDFHDGPVHPFGQLRTWPNAVTREFCHAQLDAHRVFTPTTFLTSIFVNMVAGPLDMGNGFFDLRNGKTTRVDESQPIPTTVVSEAARTLIVFSGTTIIPDIPEYYEKYPSLLEFISAQKMPWLESKTLMGEIGKYVVMARQTRDDKWLIAAVTNEDARTLTIPLTFLFDHNSQFTARISEDGNNGNFENNKTTLQTRTLKVTANDSLTLKMAPGGGACVILEK